tara:strand:- start:97 stop:342 length:246 start_codon:yes stop_codon:yes gene_type:complete
MSDFKQEDVVISGNESGEHGGLFDIDITDTLIKKALKKVNLEQSHIDKAREVIDMLEFTKEDGKDVVYVNVGKNVQVKIVR